jgi:hypothetical protein
MNLGESPTIDNIIRNEIDQLPLQDQNTRLKYELELLIEDKYDLIHQINFLYSQNSKLSQNI